MTAVIEARAVRFAYAKRRGQPGFALSLERWSVDGNQALALLGPSGAGKTTFLKLLGGLLKPSAGELTVAGVELHRVSANARRRLRLEQVGYVLPDHPLVAALSAMENVLLPLRLRTGGVDAEARRRAALLFHELDLTAREGARPDELSTGERQRVALARALLGAPRVVLADEPTAGLDDARAASAVDLLLRLQRDRGFTLVAVSHDPRLLDRFPRTERVTDLLGAAPAEAA